MRLELDGAGLELTSMRMRASIKLKTEKAIIRICCPAHLYWVSRTFKGIEM